MTGGHVTLKTYLEYFKASKSALATVLILCAFVGTQGIVNGSEFWLAFWWAGDFPCESWQCALRQRITVFHLGRERKKSISELTTQRKNRLTEIFTCIFTLALCQARQYWLLQMPSSFISIAWESASICTTTCSGMSYELRQDSLTLTRQVLIDPDVKFEIGIHLKHSIWIFSFQVV